METKGDIQHLEFEIPSRGLIGLRNKILTSTSGEAVMTHRFEAYRPHKGEMNKVEKGALISSEAGQVTTFAVDRLQDRGRFFVDPSEQVYKGQVVGENTRENDLEVNLIKGKQLTNVRSSGTDKSANVAPKVKFSLEESMEYIREDEYLEVTPSAMRMRKIS
jgi:GTP-binding protein